MAVLGVLTVDLWQLETVCVICFGVVWKLQLDSSMLPSAALALAMID